MKWHWHLTTLLVLVAILAQGQEIPSLAPSPAESPSSTKREEKNSTQVISEEKLLKLRQELEGRITEMQNFLSRKQPDRLYTDAEQLFALLHKRFREKSNLQLSEEISHMLQRVALQLDMAEYLLAHAPKITEKESAKDAEKSRRSVLSKLDKWEKNDLQKLQILRLAKEREGKDTQDISALFEKVEELGKSLKAAAQKSDPTEFLQLWSETWDRMNLLARAAEHGLKAKNIPLRPGVTKKQIEQERYEEDKRSGCAEFMPDDHRYTICKLRGMPKPTQRQQRLGFSFQLLKDLGVTLPQECQDNMGRAKWQNPPNVDVWQYGDSLHEGFVYYVFISKFNGIESLLFKKDLSADDIAQAFLSSCWQDPSSNGMALIYKGSQPVGADTALQVLFRDFPPPHDAFGMDAVLLQKELKPPPPFVIEAFLLDTDFYGLGQKINALTIPFNTWEADAIKAYKELSDADAVRVLDAEEQARLTVLRNEFDFVKAFNDELKKGLQAGKTNYQASADALKHTLSVLHAAHPKKADFERLQANLVEIAKAYEAHIDQNIRKLNTDEKSGQEYVFRAGDMIFAFFKTAGNAPPQLYAAFDIRRIVHAEDTDTTQEELLGTLTRSANVPEHTEQRLVTFAKEGQKYWIVYFSLPFGIVPTGTRVRGSEQVLDRGVSQNRYLVLDVPGDYTVTIHLKDVQAKNEAPPVTVRFSVVP